jgi:hypothetical protein
MPATVAARKAATAPARARRASGAARTAPARRSAPRRAPSPARRRPTPAPRRAPLIPLPLAVGRTAAAVGGIADSGVVVRLTRSRLWIGVLAALLTGIVALNVIALSFNASTSRGARQADALRRQNSALGAAVTSHLSEGRVQAAAVRLGLVVPEPGAIRYLRPDADDAAEAARRIKEGELTVAAGYVPEAAALAPDPVVTSTVPVVDEPVVPPADPAAETTEAVVEEPVAPVATTTAPAAPVEGAVAAP